LLSHAFFFMFNCENCIQGLQQFFVMNTTAKKNRRGCSIEKLFGAPP
jgi:hypothetical protein